MLQSERHSCERSLSAVTILQTVHKKIIPVCFRHSYATVIIIICVDDDGFPDVYAHFVITCIDKITIS